MATLLLYGVVLRYAIARPTSPSPVDTQSVGTAPSVYATPSDAPTYDTNYRSTVEIVWSCLTVIIASSWLCVHPNVTGYRATMWQRLRERLILFSITIFAPEVMAVFAYYQWRGSRKLYTDFKERAKKLNISLLPNSRASPHEMVTTDDTKDQVDDRHDRSSSSATSASSTTDESGILLGPTAPANISLSSAMQRFWERTSSSFKAIPRVVLSFGTDPKEATWSHTHAHFIQMGGIVFKDTAGKFGFKRPDEWEDDEVRAFFDLKLTEAAVSDRSKAGALAKTLVVARVLWFLIQAIARKAQGLPIALLDVACLAFIAFNVAMYVFWWNKPLDIEYPLEIPGAPRKQLAVSMHSHAGSWVVASILVGALNHIPIGLWMYSPERQWYPRLYSFRKRVEVSRGNTVHSSRYKMTLRLTIAATSSLFGAFHTIGWYHPAPSQVECTLWRASCLVLTFYPLYLVVLYCMKRLFQFLLYAVLTPISVLCGIAYVGARLTIMTLPFFELRDLPPLIHRTVSWSRFLSPI